MITPKAASLCFSRAWHKGALASQDLHLAQRWGSGLTQHGFVALHGTHLSGEPVGRPVLPLQGSDSVGLGAGGQVGESTMHGIVTPLP